MPHNLIIRGFDNDTHSQLGDISRQKNVSMNSIIKDAVDQWLKKQRERPKRHHLLIYDNEDDLKRLLRTIDKFAKEAEWHRCFISSSNSAITEFLEKLDWVDELTVPFEPSQKDVMKYFNSILQNVIKNSKNIELCCVDFLINDIFKSSMKEAIKLEKAYDENRLEGLVFCAYRIDDLLKTAITGMIEVFDLHEQIFILKGDQIYKVHCNRESVHKLFLS
ncbi:MAG: hypothetical protein L0H53_02330 [Candidatus Nitrosocosmicus sp.]|nr:hypothetical protein [Candidatus Nitrosocosmicus sp.]MDN5867235.1 hypothetical protein [Candidatus Nitrosocosmicus sp.]